MPRDAGELATGDWIEETHAPRRRLQVLAIHAKPGRPTPNVELAVDGNPVHRLTLSPYALADGSRFKRIRA